MKMSIILCDGCGKEFERATNEVNRSQRLSRKQFCSSQCWAPFRMNIPLERRPYDHLDPGNKLDEFSPFRSHWRRLKNRKHVIEVTLQDLKDQWDRQGGKCALTGWDLEIDPTGSKLYEHSPRKASLDRIDSSLGYIPGNIQWLCMMANYAKNGFSDQDVIESARAIAEYHRG